LFLFAADLKKKTFWFSTCVFTDRLFLLAIVHKNGARRVMSLTRADVSKC